MEIGFVSKLKKKPTNLTGGKLPFQILFKGNFLAIPTEIISDISTERKSTSS